MRCLIVLAITSLVACADRSAHMNSERLDSAVPVWSVEDEVAFYDARDVTSGASGFVDPLGFAEDSHAYRLSSAIITAESRYCRSWIVTQKVNAGDGEITAHWICEGSSGQVRAGILEVLDDAYCVRSIVSDLKDDLFSIYSMNMGQSDVLDDSRFDVLDASTAYVTLMPMKEK